MIINKKWRQVLASENGQDIIDEDILLEESEVKKDDEMDEVIQAEKEDISEVVESTSETSEEIHGGSEATGDIEDSPNALDEGQEQNEDFDSEGESDSADQEENDDSESEQSENEEDNFDDDDRQDYNELEGSGNSEKNHLQTFSLQAARMRRLANAFATVISKVAEDLAGQIVEGDDEWDMQSLMERRITKRPLFSCRQSREKTSVVLVLDTSGSCSQQANFFASIASAAAKTGDVEMYDAPNGDIRAKLHNGRWVRDNSRWWEMKNRTILFFGDFDGGDGPVWASHNKNKVYWFSCEGDRYNDMDEHDWCQYTLSDFKGKYFPCEHEIDFMKISKKLR